MARDVRPLPASKVAAATATTAIGIPEETSPLMLAHLDVLADRLRAADCGLRCDHQTPTPSSVLTAEADVLSRRSPSARTGRWNGSDDCLAYGNQPLGPSSLSAYLNGHKAFSPSQLAEIFIHLLSERQVPRGSC